MRRKKDEFSVDIKTLKDRLSPEEWKAREKELELQRDLEKDWHADSFTPKINFDNDEEMLYSD